MASYFIRGMDADLLWRLKARAVEQKTTLREIIILALRSYAEETPQPIKKGGSK